MRAWLALAILLASAAVGIASDIRRGAIVQVKPDSVWFQDIDRLTRWQALRKAGDKAALAAYETETLGSRDAWQFGGRLKVKVLGHAPKHHRVYVEMLTPGRMEGTEWFLDVDALAR